MGFPCHSAGKESTCQWRRCKRLRFDPWVRKIPWRRKWQPTPVFLDFPGGSTGKESACNTGDLGLIPGLGRSPGEGKGYPLQYPGQENSMDCIVHGVTKSWTRLSDFHFHSLSQFSPVTQSCLTLCDPMNYSMPGLPVHHQLPEFTQTHLRMNSIKKIYL